MRSENHTPLTSTSANFLTLFVGKINSQTKRPVLWAWMRQYLFTISRQIIFPYRKGRDRCRHCNHVHEADTKVSNAPHLPLFPWVPAKSGKSCTRKRQYGVTNTPEFFGCGRKQSYPLFYLLRPGKLEIQTWNFRILRQSQKTRHGDQGRFYWGLVCEST